MDIILKNIGISWRFQASSTPIYMESEGMAQKMERKKQFSGCLPLLRRLV